MPRRGACLLWGVRYVEGIVGRQWKQGALLLVCWATGYWVDAVHRAPNVRLLATGRVRRDGKDEGKLQAHAPSSHRFATLVLLFQHRSLHAASCLGSHRQQRNNPPTVRTVAQAPLPTAATPSAGAVTSAIFPLPSASRPPIASYHGHGRSIPAHMSSVRGNLPQVWGLSLLSSRDTGRKQRVDRFNAACCWVTLLPRIEISPNKMGCHYGGLLYLKPGTMASCGGDDATVCYNTHPAGRLLSRELRHSCHTYVVRTDAPNSKKKLLQSTGLGGWRNRYRLRRAVVCFLPSPPRLISHMQGGGGVACVGAPIPPSVTVGRPG